MNKSARIFVAGHRGLVGAALLRRLHARGYENLIVRTSEQLDLRDQAAVNVFFANERPEHVLLAAARVGGIHANNAFPAEFIRDNLQIQTNVIDAAYTAGVQKLLFLGSTCVYPKLAQQPIPESALLAGPLEPTNEWYAIAKIAGVKMCQAYRRQYGFNAISVMPTNLYGPGDNYDLTSSHVLPALIRKCHEAKVRGDSQVVVWGTGSPRREFLHVDDLADACLFLMQRYEDSQPINVGWGGDIAIRDLVLLVRDIVGFDGHIVYDTTKPDGTPRKLVDASRILALGWAPKIGLRDGICETYAAYQRAMGMAEPAAARPIVA